MCRVGLVKKSINSSAAAAEFSANPPIEGKTRLYILESCQEFLSKRNNKAVDKVALQYNRC